MQGELIYQILNGDIEEGGVVLPDGIDVVDEFADGRECGRLYDRIYKAKLRLGQRLGTDEDPDVEEIIGCMDQIARILAIKMFECGVKIVNNKISPIREK